MLTTLRKFVGSARIRFVVQVLVTVAILYWLFRDPDKRSQMWSAWQGANRSWFMAGLAAYGVVVMLGTLRWHILLGVQGIHLTFRRVLRLFMIGAFFNLFMLGTVGGDVVKAFYLLRESTQKKAAAFLTVLMDRLVGLVALIALSVAIMGVQYGIFLAAPGTKALFLSVAVILAGAAGAILFSLAVTGLGLVHKLPRGLPARAKIVELSAAYNLYARAWRASLAAFLLSIVAHLSSFMIFYFTARAFTDSVSLRNILTVMPIVNTITALPISVNGVGVREGLFEQLLGTLYAVPNEISVLVSLTGFMVIAGGSSIGGLVYLLYRPGEHIRLRSISDDVHAVEESIARQQ
jgi:hypothetical protein